MSSLIEEEKSKMCATLSLVKYQFRWTFIEGESWWLSFIEEEKMGEKNECMCHSVKELVVD
jgi:hypothetical protein